MDYCIVTVTTNESERVNWYDTYSQCKFQNTPEPVSILSHLFILGVSLFTEMSVITLCHVLLEKSCQQ